MNKNKSTTYYWKGITLTGDKVYGIIQATSVALAKAELGKQGIISKRITKRPRSFFIKKITPSHLSFFSRQIATMIKTGIPLIHAFDIAAKNQTHKLMKQLIQTIKKDIENGFSLSEALDKHPAFFNQLTCNLVDAGEKSGTLEVMLDKVANYKETMESIKKKVRKALVYPIAVLLIACIVTFALLTLVVPQFESLFKSFGAELPLFTQLIISLSSLFQIYWPVFFTFFAILAYAFVVAQKHSSRFNQLLDKAILKIPFLGAFIVKTIMARFSRTLAITFAAGLPLVDSLKAVSGVTGNYVYSRATDKIREEVSSGQQMQVAMKNTLLFPNMVTQMVAIGEDSGALESMLSKIADFYEEEVDNVIDILSHLIEPVVMTALGLLVGSLVIAMYLPIFKLGEIN